jgi:chromosome segregation ATPase
MVAASGKSSGRAPALMTAKSITEAVQELRARASQGEERFRREQSLRQALQGQLEDARIKLEREQANSRRLESLVVKLSVRSKEQELLLDEESRLKEERDVEARRASARASEQAKRADATRSQIPELQATIESLRRELHEGKAAHEALQAKLREAETLARAARERQVQAERRAGDADEARRVADAKAEAASKTKASAEQELETIKAAQAETRFANKALTLQRDNEASKRRELEQQIAHLRRELDSVSSIFLVSPP